MGKITIEFDSAEEAEDAQTALDGWKWKSSMWDLDQELRSISKYGSIKGREATGVEQDMAELIRESIRDILNNNHINLD